MSPGQCFRSGGGEGCTDDAYNTDTTTAASPDTTTAPVETEFAYDFTGDDLGLETPYQLVRDGTWTIDRLTEHAKSAANLNGDDSFAWNEKGNAIYGLASYDDSRSSSRISSASTTSSTRRTASTRPRARPDSEARRGSGGILPPPYAHLPHHVDARDRTVHGRARVSLDA